MQKLFGSHVEALCVNMLSEFQNDLSWQWDSRFNTALTQFKIESKEGICAVLQHHLSLSWDKSNIKNAPDAVKIINSRLGNLQSGQLLFTSDPELGEIVFCAWWPWGNGENISIRIAPSFHDLTNLEKIEKIQLLKNWFGI